MVTREQLRNLRKQQSTQVVAKEVLMTAIPENRWTLVGDLTVVAGAGILSAVIDPATTILGVIGTVCGAALGIGVANVIAEESGRDAMVELANRAKEKTLEVLPAPIVFRLVGKETNAQREGMLRARLEMLKVQ